jgi:DtxR family transcriptional regulator, Mn-dependent transcriptional regulator
MINSLAEENYLKTIFKLSENNPSNVSTNDIANRMGMKAASVTDMLQKLSDKKLIRYKKYQGVNLTPAGNKIALGIIRKHRLWELFLTSKLGFKWDEVHDIAEQLEHIRSEKLVQHLDLFLGKPKFDPHGDPIPDENGKFHSQKTFPLSDAKKAYTVTITGVVDHNPSFLQYLDQCGLALGKKIKVQGKTDYDNSMNISFLNSKQQLFISFDVAKNILVAL